MPGIARVGIDSAGGTILGGGQSTVYCNGALIAVLGDAVAGHGLPPHAAPVMAEASSTVFAGGIAICRAGDIASCGDPATGSSNSFAGG
jgi:uncharacterized Zn-binding protein involved in type VI secretion